MPTDKTEHFVEPTPPPERSAGLFDFTTPPVLQRPPQPPLEDEDEADEPAVDTSGGDDVDRASFQALLVQRSDGGVLHPRRAEHLLKLLVEHFKEQPFLIRDLLEVDPDPMPEGSYEGQLRVIGMRTGRLSHRIGGRGYPSTYFFHQPRWPLGAGRSFHKDPALPHASTLGVSTRREATPTTQEVPMSEPTTPTPTAAAPATVSPLRRKMDERKAAATPPPQPIDPQAIIGKLDELEEYIATILDDYRRDLRKALGLDA